MSGCNADVVPLRDGLTRSRRAPLASAHCGERSCRRDRAFQRSRRRSGGNASISRFGCPVVCLYRVNWS